MEFSKRFDPHCHSHYSNIRLIDCINRPKDLLLTAAELGLAGLALTDHEALCGHVEWLELEEELKKENKIPQDFKCALGNEIYLIDSREEFTKFFHLILIAKNTEGHRALRELSSTAWYNAFSYRGMERVPTLKSELRDIVEKYPNTLICTSACLGSEVANKTLELIELEKGQDVDLINQKKIEIVNLCNFFRSLFGEDFYLEVAPSASKDQKRYNKRIKEIAKALNIKLVFGGDAHYLTKKERFVHKAYLNSKNGEREVDDFYAYSYLMSNEEAFENCANIFTEEEFNEICKNSLEIMNKIENYNIFHNPIIPKVNVLEYPVRAFDAIHFPTIAKLLCSNRVQERYWINNCLNQLEKKKPWEPTSQELKYEKEFPGELYFGTKEEYYDRIETEARIIDIIGTKLGNCLFEYFNTFQHFIDLFWECGSLSGPGRGSSVCFLSNYLLGITQLDPIRWSLPYWRFLNEERIELPDIDTDLSPSKRKLIFKKIRQERGELNLIQVATFGTEGTRSAIQTACRGYRSNEYPDGIDNDIALYMSSLIPQERGFLWPLQDVVYGNEQKDRKPIKTFVQEIQKYDGLLDIMLSIEGLINKRGQHASGVMLYNNSPFETNAIMRSPNGDLITQFDLHRSEKLGDTKFDFLVTEICDKISNGVMLLKNDGYFSECDTLRQIYEKYLHPAVIDFQDKRIWDALGNGTVMDVFQFNSNVGLQTAQSVKPVTPIQMTLANAMMRLMGEEGEERPVNRYIRLKNNIDLWYNEVRNWGLSEEEIKILEPYYLPRSGVPATQEDLMMVCMDKNIAHFTLKDANTARKIVAKKQMNKIDELKEKFISQCPNRSFGEYVWKTTMGPQMGYAFALPHALAYSFVGIQTLILATNYPSIYWNCACLITNSGGDEEATDDYDKLNEQTPTEDIEEEQEKKKNKTTSYDKIAKAIGQMQNSGIKVSPPDINKSSFTFLPDAKENKIIYGIKGITRVGDDLIKEIIAGRPYSSLQDFMNRIKINKLQMVNLIKSGAFDCFGDRIEVMKEYILSVSDQKKRLTLQNMAMLIEKGLLPPQLQFEIKVFNFNKYLKKNKIDTDYLVDEIAFKFYEQHYDCDLLFLVNNQWHIKQSDWDKIYKKAMDPVREYLKANGTELLATLNNRLFQETYDKYASGSLSKWEMDSICYYHHEHELAKVNNAVYELANFHAMPEEPMIDRTFPSKDGKTIPIYKTFRFAGTVLGKDKNKGLVTLLTTTGVVSVRIFKAQFAEYDKQISRKNPDGTKTVIEKSWFSRGSKLILNGFRRGNDLVLKKYKNTPYPVIGLITKITDDGLIEYKTEREEV